jgi:biotin transport system substrate-specific component
MSYEFTGSASRSTLMEALWPRGANRVLRAVVLVVLGAALLTISAKIKVPFQPVPMTLQTLGVAVVAAALGRRLGVATVLTYLGAGLAGLPVFTNTPPALPGPLYMVGPTGGYLLGFIVAAFVVGALAERGWSRSLPRLFLAMLLGDLAILSLGVCWLAIGGLLVAGSPALAFSKALQVGFYPFVLGSLVKEALGATLIRGTWGTLKRL